MFQYFSQNSTFYLTFNKLNIFAIKVQTIMKLENSTPVEKRLTVSFSILSDCRIISVEIFAS